MAELTASRESDARVAVAMGCSVKWVDAHGHGPEPLCGCEPDQWGDRPHVEPGDLCTIHPITPYYTSNPALVVPMMERIQLLSDSLVQLRLGRDGATWECLIDCYLLPRMDYLAATANLAIASALLAVWKQARGGGDAQ